ncbi:pRL2-23 [Streptomyces reniochalinae]|uniref:PRL2-23 n=1 Tax=Streptomyces reniochalinae TaxID=2250578 RepID=A0A367E7Z5_9ACTN|nr:pRL2-23 [Streptomyces reniochalinae]RCG14176.1 pRL2-23 [Streptomyces reniochalinae]
MWASLIAVIGTLTGALLSGLLQHRAVHTERADARRQALRRDQLDAVTALAVAVSDHRRTMWESRQAMLAGADAARVLELREAAHETRSAITAPAVRIRLLIRDADTRAAADEAALATYRMRDAADLDELTALRSEALAAHDAFVSCAGMALA